MVKKVTWDDKKSLFVLAKLIAHTDVKIDDAIAKAIIDEWSVDELGEKPNSIRVVKDRVKVLKELNGGKVAVGKKSGGRKGNGNGKRKRSNQDEEAASGAEQDDHVDKRGRGLADSENGDDAEA